jgi:nucleoside-diphosphate-sugar epimerase
VKRVLVTGATGFIGRHCLQPLLENGYDVLALGNRDHPDSTTPRGLSWHRVDLLDEAATASLMGRIRPTHLLHLAWYAEPNRFWTALENLSWVAATARLLQLFGRSGGERAVLAGSCAEYQWRYGLCSEEFTPCEPATLYGACKHGAHVVFDAWSRQTGISGAWGRIFFLYGPHEHPTRLVRSVITDLLKNRPARCTEGSQRRDFLHVQDVAAAFVALLGNQVSGAVNIASGTPTPVREVVWRIADQLGRRDLVQLGTIDPGAQAPVVYADVTRLRNEVGFAPRYDLDSGIAQTIEWARRTELQPNKTTI